MTKPLQYVCTIAADRVPYLLVCAFVANAASFVLPISNPANLVVIGANMPALGDWLVRFALTSVAAIGATFFLLRLTQGANLTFRPLLGVGFLPHDRSTGWIVDGLLLD